MLILGIETSCDDTAVAIIDHTYSIKSSIVSSQVKIHSKYGGVVPELASRQHLTNIIPVFNECLQTAQINIADIDAVAVTQGPGLVVSLLVGLNFAKGLAFSLNKPLIAVNHLIAHMNAVLLEHAEIPLPFLGLVASGGHTNLFFSEDNIRFESIAKTRDDAVGEAYDKVAKMLNLGYPGGPIIDKLARDATPGSVKFPAAKMSDNSLDFSFSGLKTAFYYYLKKKSILPDVNLDHSSLCSLLASFQNTAIAIIEDRLIRAIDIYKPRALIISGGVACNSLLRAKAHEICEQYHIPAFIPSPALCTDNAAMTAVVGLRKYHTHFFSPLSIDAELGGGSDLNI
ncbi:MAG: tRNA (adenosine(37)-N6)-threonylcarbamoyltransferase complex transferase subunit TsaD [Candidatus Fischerbacteria bacterium RBG_13_37_8]|uniref:tRNA N6-adenosine threonylcarbamoyltransferase n=1 Tax=Candidatus Fischerbacteria bacterium RBG_13_37_8 TaxID=1817863 RepID=A0A1F5VDY1_9BACT|nr:MAG: tRNA (adenosine(37)-N6)-threonylcarbamoyltransferase complex transferase subunit TsaD [Candidatus Fischerbacteria bacterium RBG_13_37_8]